MRPFNEVVVTEQLGHRFKHLHAFDYLKSTERDAKYLEAARIVAERLDHLAIFVAAEIILVQEARQQRANSRFNRRSVAKGRARRFTDASPQRGK